MDSNSLSRKGFERWLDFNLKTEISLTRILPALTGVYVIKNDVLFGRFVGESDIVYIGSAAGENGLRGRIAEFFSPGPGQSTNKRINEILHSHPGLKISFVHSPSASDAEALESSLLKEYDRQHRDLPPGHWKE
jgi:hypothetical protein